MEKPEISIGIIADLQYCLADPEHNRYFQNAPRKLELALEKLNKRQLNFIVNLGDTIDREWQSFDGILPIFEKAKSKVHHVLGNHDFEVEDQYKSTVHQRMGIQKYQDFSMGNWRFIILDGNEIGTYSNLEGSKNHSLAEQYLKSGAINSNFWNGGIGEKQLSWLENVLKKAENSHEQVMIFCHFPIYPIHRHNLLNDEELLKLLSKFPCVKGWLCGHNHDGNYGMKNGTHFINFKGMVDTEHELAFSIMHIFTDRMEIEGFGSEVSAKLEF